MTSEISATEKEQLLQAAIAGRFPDERGPFRTLRRTLCARGLSFRPWSVWGRACVSICTVPEFQEALGRELRTWIGRPTALTYAATLSAHWGAEVWLKREDLAHTGAHKINNAIGQALLAKRIGATRVVAETGAGQHGVASAAACARVGLPCVVYMGEVDMERQAPNVGRMRLLGATVTPVTSGDRTLRAAIDEAMRDWVSDPTNTFYLLGSALGPHPYPYLVRELQAIVGREARAQMLELAGGLPDAVIACVGGGSNSIGMFHPFIADRSVRIIGYEAGGTGNASVRMRPPSAMAARVYCMVSIRCCCRTPTGRSGNDFCFGRPRLSGRRSRACAAAYDRARAVRGSR